MEKGGCMVRRIQGITIEIDGSTTGLTQALSDVDSASRRTTGELRQIDRALQFNPGNVELLAQQQELLAEQVQTTTTRLNVLRQAQAQVQAQFDSGQIDAEQYRRFNRELIVTENQLENLQNRLNESLSANVDESSLRRFGGALRDLGTEAQNVGREIGTALGGAATAATAGIAGLVLGTEDLNNDLARLRTNASVAGVGLEEAEGAFERLFAISGEADSSVEAVSQLLASGFQGEELSGVLDNVASAAIRFSDTLNVEGISDGLQETLTNGSEAAGQFAELLTRSNVDVDAFNETLGGLSTQAERNTFALQTLNDIGLTETLDTFRELNPEVAASREAQANLQTALSDLSLILTPLITLVTDLATRFVEFATANPQLVTGFAIVSAAITALAGAFAFFSPLVSALASLFPVLATVIGGISAPIAIAVLAIGGIVAALVAAYSQSETFRDGVATVFGAIRDFVVEAFGRVSDFVTERIQLIKDFWDENGSQIQQAFENVFNAVQTVIEAVFPVIQSIIEGVIDAIRNVIDGGLNFILGIIKTFSSVLTGDWQGAWDGVKQILSGAVEALFGLIQLSFAGRIIGIIRKFADDAINFFRNLGSGARSQFDEIVSSATSRFEAVRDAILRPIERARDGVKGIIDSIKGFFTGLDLRLPEIRLPKLPRVRVNGEFSLNPPRVPSFEFYAKGGIMTRPTAFGINPNTGSTMVGGEVPGMSEAVLPLNAETLGTIGRAIANQMGGNNTPSTIVVQSVLDGRIIAETITPFVSQNQQSTTNLRAASRGVNL